MLLLDGWVFHIHSAPPLIPSWLTVDGEMGGNGKCGKVGLIAAREDESPTVLSFLI